MIKVEGLNAGYGAGAAKKLVLSDVTFEVPAGRFMTVVGPSGSGKTTLLRCISGLGAYTGHLEVDGEMVSGPAASLAVVFQDYSRSMFPWLTVRANVELPCRGTGMRKAARRRLAEEALELVGLPGSGSQHLWEMSGGMQQRVAIARAVVVRPKTLIMDEPFASVDAQTRMELEDMVRRVQRELGITALLVTHDIDESVYLADQVIVMGGSPTTVVLRRKIDLGEERDQLKTRNSPEFVAYRTEVFEQVRGARSGHPTGTGRDDAVLLLNAEGADSSR